MTDPHYITYRTRSEFEKVFKDYCDNPTVKNDISFQSLLLKNRKFLKADTTADGNRNDTAIFPLGRMSPMTYAAFKDRQDVIEKLLQNDVEIDEKDSDGNTALLIASSINNDVMVQFLLEKGANPKIYNKKLIYPLMAASKIGSIPIVGMLLDVAKTTIDNVDEIGRRALYYAAENNHTEIMKMLRDKGATYDIESITSIYNQIDPKMGKTVIQNINNLFHPRIEKRHTPQPEQPKPDTQKHEHSSYQPDTDNKQPPLITNPVKSQDNILPLVFVLLI